MRKLTTETFIIKARLVHGDKYDYSKVVYINSSTKICIICKEHGEFWQTPNNHLRGQQCGKCCGLHKTTETIKAEFIEVHGYRYDYSLVDYKGWDIKVKIICQQHGIFEQTPNSHLSGNGCKPCANEKIGDSNRRKWKDVLLEMIEIHGNLFDYSESDYIRMNERIKIKCKICSHIFYQTPNNHISKKHRCPKCAGNARINWDEFLERANEKHNSFYGYPEHFDLRRNTDKIPITCPTHGIFNQQVAKHLQGQGCPKCTNKVSKPEQELFEYIKSLCPDAEQSNRKLIKPYEIDIYIDTLKIGIEFNGTYWHSEKFRNKNHRKEKTIRCNKAGITLIHVEEDNWYLNKEDIKNEIKKILNGN